MLCCYLVVLLWFFFGFGFMEIWPWAKELKRSSTWPLGIPSKEIKGYGKDILSLKG